MRTLISSFLFVFPWSAQAQLGLEAYSLTHLVGVAKSPGTKGMLLGGCWVAVQDRESYNPAQLARIGRPFVSWKHFRTKFEDIDQTSLIADQHQLGFPLGLNQGLLLVHSEVDSGIEIFSLLGFPAQKRLTEESWSVGYGQKISDRLSVGFFGAPIMETAHRFSLANGMSLAEITSQVSLKGGRLGWEYQIQPNCWLAGIYDNFSERVNLVNFAAGATAAGRFHSTNLVLGLGAQVAPGTKVYLEKEQGTFSGNRVYTKISYWHVGLEHRINNNVNLLAGLSSGSLSLGVQVSQPDDWQLLIGFANDIYSDEWAAAFGLDNQLGFVAISKEWR